MRNLLRTFALILAFGLVAGCSGGPADPATPGAAPATPGKEVYFGWVLGVPQITAVAFDVDPADAQGNRAVRAYVCDGLGQPEGKALWFTGPVNPDSTTTGGQIVTLTSVGGTDKLDIDHLSTKAVTGAFTDAAGTKATFAAYPATQGAGIYEVTFSEDRRYTGTSTDGSLLAAQADPAGKVNGTITIAGGETITFNVNNLALASPAELSANGLTEASTKFADVAAVPGEYVAVIAPAGTHWLGRSGNVRGGKGGKNIIGIDKKD